VVGKIAGGQLTLTADEAGIIETDEAHGSINYETGFVDIYFYKKTKKSDHPEIVDEIGTIHCLIIQTQAIQFG
jgi:hypothetical protein